MTIYSSADWLPATDDPASCPRCASRWSPGWQGEDAARHYQQHAARRLRLGVDGLPATARWTRQARRTTDSLALSQTLSDSLSHSMGQP